MKGDKIKDDLFRADFNQRIDPRISNKGNKISGLGELSDQCHLPEIPGGWRTERIAILQQTFHLTLPSKPDLLLDDPVVLAAHQRNDYMPYWAYLWPAAILTAEAVMSIDWPKPTDALELGAGIGLVGLAALARELNVTFSDHDPTAVSLARHNARRNGFTNANELVMDWNQPTADRFSIILACDILYEKKNHSAILNLIDTMLAQNGLCIIGDPGREFAAEFIELAKEKRFRITLSDEYERVFSEFQSGQFQILKIRRF